MNLIRLQKLVSDEQLRFKIFISFKSFNTCIFSLKYIGFTSMVFGAVGAILSPIFGYLTRFTTHAPFIVFMLMCSICNSIFLLTWTPDVEKLYIIFMVAIAFGISQAYANGQVRGLFIIYITTNKTVFCFATLFQTIGFCTGFVLSLVTCTQTKLIIYFVICLISLICFITLCIRDKITSLNQVNQVDVSKSTEMKIIDSNSERF